MSNDLTALQNPGFQSPSQIPNAPQMITVIGDPTNSPTLLNEFTALSLPAFWQGVRILSTSLASLPRSVCQESNGIHIPVKHPLNKRLQRKMNVFEQSPFQIMETWYHHAIVYGNGYLWNRPDGYYNLNPELVTPFRMLSGPNVGQYYYVRTKGTPIVLMRDECLHIPGLGFDGLVGYSIIQMMLEPLEAARNQQTFMSRYYKKGTQIQGSVEFPAATTKEQVQSMIDAVKNQHSGMTSDYGLMIVTGGGQLKNTTLSPEASQLIESRTFSIGEMCRILNIQPIFLHEYGRATWGNSEEQGRQFVKYSLREWIEKTEEEFSARLLSESEADSGLTIKLSVEDLIRGDREKQSLVTINELNAGLITANEGRAYLGYPPSDDPEADKLRVPINFPVPGLIPPTPPAKPPQYANQSPPKPSYTALMPVIADACRRIDIKSDKAFQTHSAKPREQLTIWANVFADQQAGYVRESFDAINETLREMKLPELDVNKLGDRYAGAIRKRAATSEQTTLNQLIITMIGEQNDKTE